MLYLKMWESWSSTRTWLEITSLHVSRAAGSRGNARARSQSGCWEMVPTRAHKCLWEPELLKHMKTLHASHVLWLLIWALGRLVSVYTQLPVHCSAGPLRNMVLLPRAFCLASCAHCTGKCPFYVIHTNNTWCSCTSPLNASARLFFADTAEDGN